MLSSKCCAAVCKSAVRISYISVVIDVHAGRAGELFGVVLESRILVRYLDPFLSQGLTHGFVLLQRDPEEVGSKNYDFHFKSL